MALFAETGATARRHGRRHLQRVDRRPRVARSRRRANPVTAGGTGTRYFATDTRGTIFYDNTASFGTAVIPTTATPVQ